MPKLELGNKGNSMTSDPEPNLQPFSLGKCFASGLAMGMCNVTPGGDSGTIALIVGIYQRIISAISHVDNVLLQHVLKGRWIAAFKHLDLGFMFPVVAGVATGILSMGSLMDYLVEHHYSTMLPIFFGLIGASCYLVAKLIHKWEALELALIMGGTARGLLADSAAVVGESSRKLVVHLPVRRDRHLRPDSAGH